MTECVWTRLRSVLVVPLVLVGREPEGHGSVAAQSEALGGLEALNADTRDSNGERLLQRVKRLPFSSGVDVLGAKPGVDSEVFIERSFEIAVPDGPLYVVGMIRRGAIADREREVELWLVEVCAERAERDIHRAPHAEFCIAGAA